MKILASIIISLSILNSLDAKSKIIYGIVYNDLGEKLHEVSISLNGNETSTITDCNGKFQIRAEKGDTLIVSKDGYLIEKRKVKVLGRNKIRLCFDYTGFKEKMEGYSSIFLPGSQPLFILDGSPPQSSYYLAVAENAQEEDFLPVIVLKGKAATDLFGECARNGAIWLRTKCGLFNQKGERVHFIEP
ncbi:MAG: carboxypeptidase-like regulatory domain-containing protein [Bacteroidia bacterium]|nr:carboxypeptidase-like regulatory domain-containing protein [Bacteroidia bacterium]